MSVYKRGKTWYADVQVGGHRIKRSLGEGKTRQDAKRLEASLLGTLNTARNAPHTISQAVLRWIDEEASRLKSYDKLRSHITAALPYLEGHSISEIATVAETMKAAMLAEGLSAATVNRRLAVLRRVANLAFKRWHWVTQPLSEKVIMLTERNERHVYLSITEVERVAAACPNPLAGDLVRVAAYTGLRRSELLGLSQRNMIDGRIVLDANTKTGRPRVIPVARPIQSIVARLPLAISDPQLRASWETARESCGYEDLRFHDLRHTFASWLAANGAQAVDIRDLLGHSTLATTNRYAHLSAQRLDSVIAALGIQERAKKQRHIR